MGLFSKKDEGYVSFTTVDIQQSADKNPVNQAAYELLCNAMSYVYPSSYEETVELEKCLDHADAAVQDKDDNEYKYYADELRDVVSWSRKRHWNFSWLLIVGVIVTVFLVNLWSEQKDKALNEELADLELIENWQKPETDLKLEMVPGMDTSQSKYEARLNSANDYKSYYMALSNNQYFSCSNTAEEERAKLDTASTREIKEGIKKWADKMQMEADKAKKEFESLNAMNFKQLRKYAIKQQKEEVSEAKGDSRFAKFMYIFFIILIPIYIFAERPYGYTITRCRDEADALEGIQKIGYILAGGLATMGAGIGFVDVITTWSDGSTSSSDDGTGPARLALKAFLFFAAIVVFCAVSCFIVIISTVMGLVRNYDWKQIFSGASQKMNTLKPKN